MMRRVNWKSFVFLLAIQGCDRGGVCEADHSFSCWSYGANGTREGFCSQVGCEWREGCSPIRCSTAMSEATCRALDHCYWSGGGSCVVRTANATCNVDDGGDCSAAGCTEGFACFGEVDCGAFDSSAQCSKHSPLCRWRKLSGVLDPG
jgi:hypothetical protein